MIVGARSVARATAVTAALWLASAAISHRARPIARKWQKRSLRTFSFSKEFPSTSSWERWDFFPRQPASTAPTVISTKAAETGRSMPTTTRASR